MSITLEGLSAVDDQKKVVDFIVDFWQTSKRAREEKELIWDEVLKHYLVYVDTSKFNNWEWRCKVARPTSQEQVDSITAAQKNALFPINDDFFSVEGMDPAGKGTSQTGIAHTELVEKRLQRIIFETRFISRFRRFLNQLNIIGSSHAQMPYRVKERTRKRWANGGIRPEQYKTFQGPSFEVHDMFNVVFDPRMVEYEHHTPRVIRETITKDEFKRRGDTYSNPSAVQTLGTPKETSDSMADERRQVYGISVGHIDKSDDVEILRYTGDITIGDQEYQDVIIEVAQRQVMVRAEEIEYFCGEPQIFCTYEEIYNEGLGRGPLEPIRGLQKLIDTFSCQKADYANLAIGGFFAYDPDNLVDPEFLLMKPQGGVAARNPQSSLVNLVPPGNPTLAFAEIADLENEVEKSTGASKTALGMMAPGRRSATEALQSHSGGQGRFNDVITHIGEMAIEPALNMLLAMDMQFNYGNANILPLQAWEGGYRVHFYGAKNSIVREMAVQMFATFTDIITRNPMFAQFSNPGEFIREWQKLLNIANPKLVRQAPLIDEFPQLAQVGKGGGSLPKAAGGPQQIKGAASSVQR